MRFDLGADRILPRWVVAFFLGGAVVLIPWIVLMFTVPQAVDVPRHWQLVWGGFDCFLVLGFAVTAFRLMTRSPRGAVTAAMTGTMLLIDAWFDVLTTHRGGQLLSILMAVFAEIPCAVICFYVSRRIVSLFEQAKDHLSAAGFTVRAGRLVPPAGFPQIPESATLRVADPLRAADPLRSADPEVEFPYAATAAAVANESGPGAARRSPAGAAGPESHAAAERGVSERGAAERGASEQRGASERGLGNPVGQQSLLAEPL